MVEPSRAIWVVMANGIPPAPPWRLGFHFSEDREDMPACFPGFAWAELDQAGWSYWAISLGASPPYPPVLVHCYIDRALPPEPIRDQLHQILLTGIRHIVCGADLEANVHVTYREEDRSHT